MDLKDAVNFISNKFDEFERADWKKKTLTKT